jgi:hypothetical protein
MLLAMPFACASSSLIWAYPQVGSTTMFEDNMTCIKMPESTASTSTPRMQHLDARYHCGCVSRWSPKNPFAWYMLQPLIRLRTALLTKPLPGPDIKRFHGALSGYKPIPHPPFGGECGRIGKSLEAPGSFPLLSDV